MARSRRRLRTLCLTSFTTPASVGPTSPGTTLGVACVMPSPMRGPTHFTATPLLHKRVDRAVLERALTRFAVLLGRLSAMARPTKRLALLELLQNARDLLDRPQRSHVERLLRGIDVIELQVLGRSALRTDLPNDREEVGALLRVPIR